MILHYEITRDYTYIRDGYEYTDNRTIDEFDYEVDVESKDIVEFLTKDIKENERTPDLIKGVKLVVDDYFDEISQVLEEDDDFYEFMKESYDDAAADFYSDMR